MRTAREIIIDCYDRDFAEEILASENEAAITALAEAMVDEIDDNGEMRRGESSYERIQAAEDVIFS